MAQTFLDSRMTKWKEHVEAVKAAFPKGGE